MAARTPPLCDDNVGPGLGGLPRLASASAPWQMILQPACLMRPVNGAGSLKDSITAAGCASMGLVPAVVDAVAPTPVTSGTSSAAGFRSSAHRMNPTPTRALPA